LFLANLNGLGVQRTLLPDEFPDICVRPPSLDNLRARLPIHPFSCFAGGDAGTCSDKQASAWIACYRTKLRNGSGLVRRSATTNVSERVPARAIIDQVTIDGAANFFAAEAAKSRISFHPGDEFDPARAADNLRALHGLGWFEDVSVEADASSTQSDPPHIQLTFHVREYPFLTQVEYCGSEILSQQQIRKLLEEKKLSPQLGMPLNPVQLHRAAVAIRSELIATGHIEARVLIAQRELSNQRVKVEFQIHDGPHLPVMDVHFSGDPDISSSVLRKQMHEIAPDAWFSGLREKNIFTPQKGEEDRINLLTYLRNHGFPQARVGAPEVTSVENFSSRTLPCLPHRRSRPGLRVDVPIEAGPLFNFGPTELSVALGQKLGAEAQRNRDPVLSNVTPGRPYSQHAVDSLQRAWELKLHRNAQRHKSGENYALRATPTFDSSTHLASVKFTFDSKPRCTVRRIDFRGNQRFPDHYLRRRIGLTEGQPLDEYTLEAGLARLARTGYFQPFKKEDIQIAPCENGRAADVVIHIHEKGRQRTSFSGGREQFGSTLGIAYTVFNLLGLDEYLSTQIDGGPEALQLGIGLAKEGFLGSRGTLALSVFDTFVRPRLTGGVQAPFQRTQSEGVNVGWSYAPSETDSIGINYGLSRSLTQFVVNQPSSGGSTGGSQETELRSATSSHSLAIGWTHYTGEQKIQMTDSVSGGWLGGDENLLRSKAEYSQIFSDPIFDNHKRWAFRTTVSAAGSYKGDMPLYALFLSGNDFVRGLRPGELGPYETLASISPSGTTTYSAAPAGSNLIAASNLEYRFPLGHEVEGAPFFDAGSGLLLPNWLGKTRPSIINSTNGLLHASIGFQVQWTLPAVGVPFRVDYSLNVLRLNRALLMPDGSVFRVHNRLGLLGWGLGSLL
jgi:outer membrane protein insertion porin family